MNKLSNRVDIDTSWYGVYINSLPYKSLKYALKFILYLFFVGLWILIVIYRDIIFYENKLFSDFPGIIVPIFSMGFMFTFAFSGLPFFFSFIKNSFFRNFFLEEHLSISDGKIKYRNSFGKRISCKLSHIKWINFEFYKQHGEFPYIPQIIPNYTPTIYLRDRNYKIVAKIMHSIKEEEIQNVCKVILDYLLTHKHFYQECNVNRLYNTGKEIEFISVHQFFIIHMGKFSNEERSYYCKLVELVEQQSASEDELLNVLLSKIKDNQSNEM